VVAIGISSKRGDPRKIISPTQIVTNCGTQIIPATIPASVARLAWVSQRFNAAVAWVIPGSSDKERRAQTYVGDQPLG
jgi:hypothetical protein